MGSEEEETALLKEVFEKLEPTPMAHTHPLTTPIQHCFNWDSLFTPFTIQHIIKLYGVDFRSIRKSEYIHDDTLLYAADASAYQEALASGKLLRYWYGDLNESRECLATCIWTCREAAKSALNSPLHAKAASLAAQFYDRYILESYWIHFNPDGSLFIELNSSAPSSGYHHQQE